MSLELVAWILAAALASGVIVFVAMLSGRRALAEQLAGARSAQAVAESRLADLEQQHTALAEANRNLNESLRVTSGEREARRTALDGALADLERERAMVTNLRASVESSGSRASQLEADHRVAKERADGLAAEAARLQSRLTSAEAANRDFTTRVAELGAEVSALKTERAGLQERLAQQQTWFEEQTRLFEAKIVNLTNRLFEEKSQKFTDVNKQEIDAVVAPFKAQLKEFRERVDAIHTTEARERGQLHEQIQRLTELNQQVSKQAEDLTNALTISSKATGDWGEMILQRILEDSGLRAGKEYVLQHTVEGDEEDRQRPDAVINLPDGKQVVVDSKVSNKAWKEYCAASDDETRDARLAEHLASVRAHVRELSSRNYQHSPDLTTIEFVLMFVPIEAAYLTALSRDESLFNEAWRAKVYIVSPGMLMASLKLIEGMWVYQRRKESADKIAEAGRKLYEKLSGFTETFVEVGDAIHRAHGVWEKAQGQLSTGRGNAIRLAEKMLKLGVTPAPGKAIPAKLVELAGEVDEEDDADASADPARTVDGVSVPLG